MEAGYFDPARPLHDYRQPDVYVARREHMTPRGLEVTTPSGVVHI